MTKGKKFTTDALLKAVKDEFKSEKRNINGFAIDIQQKFKPSDIADMGTEFWGVFVYLAKNKIQVNFSDLINYFIIKYFSSVGKEISDEITVRVLKEENRSEDHLIGVAALCNLEVMRNLIDTGMFSRIIVEFPTQELEKIYQIHDKALGTVNDLIDKEKAKLNEKTEEEISA